MSTSMFDKIANTIEFEAGKGGGGGGADRASARVARAVLMKLRDPTSEVLFAMQRAYQSSESDRQAWQAAIDAILAEN